MEGIEDQDGEGASGEDLSGDIGFRMKIYVVIILLAMIAVIVSVDLLFLRNHFWIRLIVSIGIVLVFIALYFTVLRKR